MIDPNMLKQASNPRGFALKKWFSQILANKYPPHDSIVERVGMSLITEGDLKDFGTLMGSVYEAGYMKAINDYRGEIEKLGIKIHIIPDSSQPK